MDGKILCGGKRKGWRNTVGRTIRKRGKMKKEGRKS